MSALQEIAGSALLALALSAGFTFYGFAKGRAIGWREGYFSREDFELKRRDALGQFKKLSP